MVTAEQVVSMIQAEMPDAEVSVSDLTGGGDHFEVTVVSTQFEGRTLVQQHQMVYDALQGKMGDDLHALAIQTIIPE